MNIIYPDSEILVGDKRHKSLCKILQKTLAGYDHTMIVDIMSKAYGFHLLVLYEIYGKIIPTFFMNLK